MLVVLENIRWVWGLPCVGRAAYRHGVSRDDHVGLGVTTGMGHPGMIMWVWGLPRVGGAAYRHGASRDGICKQVVSINTSTVIHLVF